MKKLVVICFALIALNSAAFANPILFWDFENTPTVGVFAATSSNDAVDGTAWNTDFQWENLSGDTFLMTRYFGYYFPIIQFTTTAPLQISDLTFDHIHNHTPEGYWGPGGNGGPFPTYPNYATQLQLDRNDGNGFVDIGSLLPLSPANGGTTATIALNLDLQPGTYAFRWDARDLQLGAENTDTEFFGLNNISLNDSTVPEPASLLLVAAGGLALLFRRLRCAD